MSRTARSSSSCARASLNDQPQGRVPGLVPVTAAEVAAAAQAGTVIIDTRPVRTFAAEHLPGAVHLEFNLADLTERAELVLPKGLRAVVHAEPASTVAASEGLLEDAGLSVLGHLEGGLAAWRAAGHPVHALPVLDVDELRTRPGEWHICDVRERFEFVHGHIAGAELVPSGDIWAKAGDVVPVGRPVAVVCSGVGRAAFAASVLASHGVPAVIVDGGMYEWLRRGYPVEKGA